MTSGILVNFGWGNGLPSFWHQALTGTNVDFLSPRTPHLCIFLAEKMRMGVFGQEREEISAFLYGKKCGENADGSIRTGTWRNLRVLIWKRMRRKCGWEYSDRNAEKSPHSYMEKNAEEMRRKCGWEYSDRNTEKSPHYIRISAITRRIFPHSQFSASQP